MGVTFVIQAVLFIASVAYQVSEQRKLKKKQKAAEEARKGFEITVSGTAAPVPIVYGKNLLGGIEVKHSVTSAYTSASLSGATHFVQNFANTTTTGDKNEYLHVQHALCQSGIEDVQSVKVNDLAYNDAGQRFSHSIRTFPTGGTADPVATANGLPSTNLFTGTAFASSTLKLDRDDPQYNGVPMMGFLVKGRKVRAVELNTGVYSLAAGYVYSNNPSLCLLDYLLNTDFGRGLAVADVDLQSFYDAAVVCGTTVSSARAISGAINGGAGTRNIPLYECNITLNPENTVRDNIREIMETMALAELIWNSEGKYKLLVEYPTSTVETDALVDASHYFVDADIIRDDVTISWASASDRFNQATVTFKNEHEDFKSDSMTWPLTNSAAHTTYLTEDNSQPFVGSASLPGVTDPYHALATAEQMVRQSRSVRTLSLTVTKKGLSLEPGDFINVTSTTSNIDDEVFRVQSIEVMSDFTVKLTCYSFDYTALAWNTNDDIAYSTRPTYDFTVEPVTSLVYTAGAPSGDYTALGELTWTAPTDGSFKCVVYYTNDSSDLVILGETSSSSFFIYPRPDWTDAESVTFTVKAQTPFGRLSTGVTVVNTVTKTPNQPNTFGSSEALFQTNKASGVKTRLTMTFVQPSGGVQPREWKVEAYRDEDGSTYATLGYTTAPNFIYEDARTGNYHFRVTAISWYDDESVPLVGLVEVLGLSATPGNPTNFSGKATETNILFTWDTPSDLDVTSGGTSEMRYVRDHGGVPNWDIAQVIIPNISGDTTTATLPLAPGHYMLKHIDSTGTPCAVASDYENTLDGPDYNAISVISEDPTFAGTKTNCSVISSELVKGGGATTMTYNFSNTIDLGSVESVRLVPDLVAAITDGTTTVATYTLISAVENFAGPVISASLSFQVRHTDDDPSVLPNWSDWETFTVGDYNHRGFEFRLVGTTALAAYTITISDLSLTADKKDIIKRGTSTGSASVDTTVTFAASFYGGIGDSDIPYVGANTVGGAAGDDVNIVSITKSAFTYSVYNGGARVARAITWQAVGQ